uniref:Secreted protein n=1 Tax=Ixodes ricinus TaxID=34613 RepID=A0A6B0U8H4_IXORI
MSHRVSISWNLALYVFVLGTPVLASNSNKLPNELLYNCSFFISCFCALYIVKAYFPCVLLSHNFLCSLPLLLICSDRPNLFGCI